VLRIFISATTTGLLSYRAIAREVVAAQGYVPLVQEHFSTPKSELTRQIQSNVYHSHALLGIVGPFYGHESNARDRDGAVLSYSQYEVEYALACRRPCLVLISDGAFEVDGTDPETAAHQRSQAAFIESLKSRRDRRLGCVVFTSTLEFAVALAKIRWQEWFGGR